MAAALNAFPSSPHVLQHFHKPALLQHPVYDESYGEVLSFPCKVRLCPYYFVNGDKPALGGAIATLCPPNKKILHGMRDALLLPAEVPSAG